MTILVSFDGEDAVLIEGQYGRIWYVELWGCFGVSFYESDTAFLVDGSTDWDIGFSAKLLFSDGDVCDVRDAEEPEEIEIIEILPDDDFVLVGYDRSDYVIEFSLGCFGLNRYEGRTLYVVGASYNLGSSAKVLLPDGDVCDIRDSERL